MTDLLTGHYPSNNLKSWKSRRVNIEVGAVFPDIKIRRMGQDGPESVSTQALFSGKRALLLGVPGAFTPTCSDQHLPGFLMHAEEIFAKGIDMIACVAVNDIFVMARWL